jgi:hypothetical protein
VSCQPLSSLDGMISFAALVCYGHHKRGCPFLPFPSIGFDIRRRCALPKITVVVHTLLG